MPPFPPVFAERLYELRLTRMNRRYTAEEYREKCRLLRRYYENPALTTDVIAGFPGETEEEFEESLAFVDSIHFYETHIFHLFPQGGNPRGTDGRIRWRSL